MIGLFAAEIAHEPWAPLQHHFAACCLVEGAPAAKVVEKNAAILSPQATRIARIVQRALDHARFKVGFTRPRAGRCRPGAEHAVAHTATPSSRPRRSSRSWPTPRIYPRSCRRFRSPAAGFDQSPSTVRHREPLARRRPARLATARGHAAPARPGARAGASLRRARGRRPGRRHRPSSARKIFEPFPPAPQRGAAPAPGLAVCFSIVGDTTGWIAIDDAPGALVFSVYLPASRGSTVAERAPVRYLQVSMADAVQSDPATHLRADHGPGGRGRRRHARRPAGGARRRRLSTWSWPWPRAPPGSTGCASILSTSSSPICACPTSTASICIRDIRASPAPPTHHDHRVRLDRDRDPGGQARRVRLHHQAVRDRGAGSGRSTRRSTEHGAAQRGRAPAARASSEPLGLGEHRRRERRRCARCWRCSRAVARLDAYRADHRRERHRQGAGRARDPLQLAARAAARSSRVNCAAVPETLLESELFGHEKGAFTGAHADKPGLFAAGRRRHACSSTRSASCRCALQAKLLRVLQEREVAPGRRHRADHGRRRAWSRRPTATSRRWSRTAASARISTTASTSSTSTCRRCARAREDILPPRGALSSIAGARPGSTRAPARCAPTAQRALLAYPWPGNVRELDERASSAAVALCHACERDHAVDDLPSRRPRAAGRLTSSRAVAARRMTLGRARARVHRARARRRGRQQDPRRPAPRPRPQDPLPQARRVRPLRRHPAAGEHAAPGRAQTSPASGDD